MAQGKPSENPIADPQDFFSCLPLHGLHWENEEIGFGRKMPCACVHVEPDVRTEELGRRFFTRSTSTKSLSHGQSQQRGR